MTNCTSGKKVNKLLNMYISMKYEKFYKSIISKDN